MPLSVRTIVLIYLVLFGLAIPWYLPEDPRLVLGMPLWVGTALLFSFIISLFTAWLLLRMQWPDE